MKTQTFNPYLPSWEYVPDGEPHVFGDRVYVYGSHDAFGAPIFCVKDYVCWSAPVNDLSDWRYEGVIYRKNQDPRNPLGLRCLYAPDVTRGPDGRYYLYYAFDFLGEIGVAVCDTPAGQYRYYGKVRHKNGAVWGRKSGEQFPFDPAVLTDDDGKVWLYSGFATKVPRIASGLHDLRNDGGTVMELEPDMVTIRQEPRVLFPTKGKPGAFPHAFFEASSIRKVGKKYCFVYSSEYNHDLCYAMSDYPDRGFVYGGVLVDLGDLFLWGNTDETRADNYLGNTHGGLAEINGEWYIFYHRQTNRSSYARQACAEKLTRLPDGRFMQAPVTSCGLNGGPLRAKGHYEARIACNLWSKGHTTGRVDGVRARAALKQHPYFTQSGRDRERDGDQYIANMCDGAVAGFKYFDLSQTGAVRINIKGKAEGTVLVRTSEKGETVAEIPVKPCREIHGFSAKLSGLGEKEALFFSFQGKGAFDFFSFDLKEDRQ